jgi:hypothetical protein
VKGEALAAAGRMADNALTTLAERETGRVTSMELKIFKVDFNKLANSTSQERSIPAQRGAKFC